MSATSSALKDKPSPNNKPWWANPYDDEGSDLWSNSKFKDFQIVIGDRVLGVHKCVLAAKSPVFAAMLTSGLTSEAQTGQLEIQDFDFDTVENVIQFCYCDHLYFIGGCARSIWKVLRFGHKYDIQHLIEACLHQIKIYRNDFDNSERTFIVKSAFDLGCNEVIDTILDMFVKINGEIIAECPLPALGHALEKDEYCKDLKIICDEDGTEFSIHKFILALRSPVFDEIFEKMAENGDTSGQLKINNIKSAVVQKAVKFFYIGYIPDEDFENNPHLLLGVLEFADRFKVKQLVSLCLKKIDQAKNTLGQEMISNYVQTAGNFESKKIFHFIVEILGIFGTPCFEPFDFKKVSCKSFWN